MKAGIGLGEGIVEDAYDKEDQTAMERIRFAIACLMDLEGFTIGVHFTKMVQGEGFHISSSHTQPFNRLIVILRNTLPLEKHHAQVVLRLRVTLFCGFARCLLWRPFHQWSKVCLAAKICRRLRCWGVRF
jgi:hypothetical protein